MGPNLGTFVFSSGGSMKFERSVYLMEEIQVPLEESG